jgi:hypothetical protein
MPGSEARGGMACRLCVLRDLRRAVDIEGNPDRHQRNDQAHASVESLSQYSPHPSSGHPPPMPCIPFSPNWHGARGTALRRGWWLRSAGYTRAQRCNSECRQCSRWVLEFIRGQRSQFTGRAASGPQRATQPATQRSPPSPRAAFALFHTKRGERAGVRGAIAILDPQSSRDKGRGQAIRNNFDGRARGPGTSQCVTVKPGTHPTRED